MLYICMIYKWFVAWKICKQLDMETNLILYVVRMNVMEVICVEEDVTRISVEWQSPN